MPDQARPMEVPISYERLREVYALCGSDAHDLDACPKTPKGPVEVIMEKFGAIKIQTNSDMVQNFASPSPHHTQKWVTILPKKHGRSIPFSKWKSAFKLVVTLASPIVKLVSNGSSPHQANSTSVKSVNPGTPSNPIVVGGVKVSPIVVAPTTQSGPSLVKDGVPPPADPLTGEYGQNENP